MSDTERPNRKQLLEEARSEAENAYAPYSDYAVGAAVLTGDGQIFTGANIENSSYGASVCAEQVAIFKAVSDGSRSIAAIAIWPLSDAPQAEVPPCGVCRQVLSEFMDSKGVIYTRKAEYTLEELIPDAFRMDNDNHG